ncbi:ERMES complex Ca(2+)-binding regulatory GTPase gem1 [Orbilia blumenaviensis]|uniref:Mitochondrial Rho GTPase n=1 Tax=Orbilia blumenaviensis TaxID=1796055 RepID=A0AAV9UJY3_9PEZI
MTGAEVRICVCGDEATGKSSLIMSLWKDEAIPTFSGTVLPMVTMSLGLDAPISTTIVDTSPLPQDRNTLKREIRKANVILLVYSDHYLPVVLCANKSDLRPDVDVAQVAEEEMMPIMQEFKEIDSCIRASAKEHRNVDEAFYLCQRAVTHPIAPLYDSKEQNLKPAAVEALRRIFFLCDKDQDGILNDEEIAKFQNRCFGKPLNPSELDEIKHTLHKISSDCVTDTGITEKGFILLNRIYAEKGRHETTWAILRTFHYTDSLSLKESFLHPKFEVPPFSSAELSPIGYRFFVDLFLLFDKDNDGGLNQSELSSLFRPTPCLPPPWQQQSTTNNFPSSTVCTENGHITLQGWLAQWSMTTFEDPKTTLEYLAYLGFEAPSSSSLSSSSSSSQSATSQTRTTSSSTTTCALKLTKPRKRRRQRRRTQRVERSVVHAYVLGSPSSGKSSLLDALLSRPFTQTYNPTIKPLKTVNSVELPLGKQIYLILSELGELEPAILENPQKLDNCDVIVYTYDSSNPDSFEYLINLRKNHKALDDLPCVYVALKADLDKTTQRSAVQPDQYTEEMGMPPPIHVSVRWSSVAELFVQIAEAALNPLGNFPRTEPEPVDRSSLYLAAGVTACTACAFLYIWRKASPATFGVGVIGWLRSGWVGGWWGAS